MVEAVSGRGALITGLVIFGVVGSLFLLSDLMVVLLGLPSSIGLPTPLKGAGVVVVVVGMAFAAWVFRYRSPTAMIGSTYITFKKLFGLAPFAETPGRKESLVVVGPQRYVRNPLYFSVILIVLGWGFAGASTFVLAASLVVSLWFRFVLIPYEEKELVVLFGAEYEAYKEGVPMLFPFTKLRRREGARLGQPLHP